MENKLYIVPTPIGNLEDITFRAIETLKNVDLILAEDTRTTGFLLKKFQIDTPTKSHHKFNEHKTVEFVVRNIQSGGSVALVSDAGTPSISDPGFLLTRECLKAGIKVECLPGATAFIPALVNSGFPTDRFCFEGFLPVKKGRVKKFNELKDEKRTVVLYESPYRLLKTLKQIKEFLGDDREVSVSRELTKMYEENYQGTVTDVILHFESKSSIKGEIVIVIKGIE